MQFNITYSTEFFKLEKNTSQGALAEVCWFGLSLWYFCVTDWDSASGGCDSGTSIEELTDIGNKELDANCGEDEANGLG